MQRLLVACSYFLGATPSFRAKIHSLSGSPTVNQTAYHLSRINYVLNVPFDEVILCGFSMYSCSIPLAHLCMLLVSAGVLAPDGMYYHNEIDTTISSQ